MRLPTLLLWALAALPLAANVPASLVAPPPVVPERGPAVCLRCHGSGKLTREKSGIKWEGSALKSFQVTCLTCNGAGKLVRAYTPDERLEHQERLLTRTANEQLARGNLPVGAAYLPAAEADALSPEAYAAIAREYPLPCGKCFGLGYACCRTCDGTGKKDEEKVLKEREREAERERRKNKGRVTHTSTVPHPYAGDDGFASAQRGDTLTCETCLGKGRTPCTACDASGLLDICKKCSGVGVETKPARKNRPAVTSRCRRCKGNGRR